jgi:release factor glutamine methyltransferase
VATDIDPRAVATARRNGVVALVGDLDSPLRGGAFDVVTAVAPYVPAPALHLLAVDARHEPRGALDGGADGLALVRRVVTGAARLLRAGGWLLTELGAEQDRLVEPTLAAAGFEPPIAWFDEEGDLRGIAARRR